MKRAAGLVVVTVVGLVLLLSYRTHPIRPLITAQHAPEVPGSSPSTAPTAPPSPGSTASPPPGGTTPSPSTRTVDGDSVDTRYGPVQVRLLLKGSRISEVQLLALPQDTSRDIEIDNVAVPILVRETLGAQSAHIDMVSGATFTSEGYAQSLQSALDRAGR